MKNLKNFWFLFSAVCLICTGVATYKAIQTFIVSKEVRVVVSNDDLYRELKEPLISTIIYHGTTYHGDGDNAQVFTYTFKGYMTNLPYRVTLSRNAQFEDCAGCIGDWQTGMFSYPECNGEYISLKEFIIQMVHTNNENLPGNSTMIWNTGGFIWRVTPTDGVNKYLIEVTSSSDKKWKICV